MAVTTQRGSLTLVDRSGKPLRPFIIWLDQRRARRAPPIAPWWRLAFKAARVSGTIDHLVREAELNGIAEHEPEQLDRAHKALLVSGWLNYRLTGRFVDSAASQVGYLPFDFRRQAWARCWGWKWSALCARREQMPDLAPVGSILGGLTRAAAEATGLPQRLQVVAAAADKACEILGAGAITPDVGALSYGRALYAGLPAGPESEGDRGDGAPEAACGPGARAPGPTVAVKHRSLAGPQNDGSPSACHGDFAAQRDDSETIVDRAAPDRGAAHADRGGLRAYLHFRAGLPFDQTSDVQERPFGDFK
jgi:FGGY family of carbohydrate kinases, N-terminal domain